MSAPTLDTPPGSQTGTSAGQRRHRKQLVLVASALMVVAIAVGTSLAVATRPVAHQAPAGAGQPATAGHEAAAQPDQGATAQPPAKPESSPTPAASAAAPALGNGDHDAYITKVDRAGNRIVVDVVQVFHDDKAVQAAVADGKSPSDAQYLTTWVRNENPRLRTLPLAGNLVVQLRGTCGEDAKDRDALLTKLAANARLDGTYYYMLTVADGKVRRIQERLAVNAC
jgi:hypothetical protein